MLRSTLFVGVAVVIAIAVFLLTLIADSPKSSPATPSAQGNRQFKVRVPALDLENTIESTESLQQITPTAEGGQLTIKDVGRTTILYYDLLEPQPHGVSQVVNPSARILFSDTLVITIRAEHATMVAPDNDLRHGDFRGNVVLSLYETTPGQTINTRHNDDLVLRLFLNEARFDIEMGIVESPGEIHLTGPQVDFRGRGLSINFNELHRRLDKLEVFHARSLRFKTASINGRNQPPEGKPPAQTQDPLPSDDPDPPVQFYRTQLEDHLEVRGASGRLNINADYLEAIFGLMTKNQNKTIPTTNSNGEIRESATPQSPVHGNRPLFEPDDTNDVIITLKGRLIVEPEPAPPADLTGANDVLVRLSSRPDSSQPVSIQTPAGQIIKGAEADYLFSTARMRVFGSVAWPLVVHVPELGTAHGTQVILDQTQGRGHLLGPGRIETLSRIKTSADPTTTPAVVLDTKNPTHKAKAPTTEGEISGVSASATKSNMKHVPTDPPPGAAQIAASTAGLELTWSDRLDLNFYVDNYTDANRQVPGRLLGLRSAVFRGDVTAHEKRFDLGAQELTLELSPPAGQSGGAQNLDRIDAIGQVHMVGSADTNPFDIRTEKLSITLSPDSNGQPRPTKVLAHKRVRTQLANVTLESDLLDISFEPADTQVAQNDAATDLSNSWFPVHKMLAEGDVRVHMADHNVELAGPRLVADGHSKQFEVFGDHDQPARISYEGDTLSGKHLVIAQNAQTVRIDGAGMLDAQLRPEVSDDYMTVAWTESMIYDHLAGAANFVGNVTVDTVTEGDRNRVRLIAPDLELHLEPINSSEGSEHPDSLLSGQREIESVKAKGQVQFIAESFAEVPSTNVPRSLEGRLTLVGKGMTFNRASELIEISDVGHMLIENYRPEADDPTPSKQPKATDSDTSNQDRAARIEFSGRGATLFQWSGGMVLDARHSDMIIEDQVKMTHRPDTGDHIVQLDADRFVLDLVETGGLKTLLAGEQPQPEIKLIRADGNVVVLQEERMIFVDHLQYTEATSTVRLWADEGRNIEVRNDRDPMQMRAKQIVWDLDHDSLLIVDIPGGIVPTIQNEGS